MIHRLWLLLISLTVSCTHAEDTTINGIPSPDMIWNATERSVTGKVTWKSGSVILIHGELEITEGSSLTVRSGVRILFGSKESGILNNGLMRLFGGNWEETFVTMEPGFHVRNGKLGQWSGISFGPTAVSGTVPSFFVGSPKSPRYGGGSLFRRTRIFGILGGVDGGLYCPHGRAPYMHNVTLEDMQGRSINIENLQEKLVMRNVAVQRREGRPYERSDVRIRGARIRLVPALERAGSVWVDGLRVTGSSSDGKKAPTLPFALSVAELADGAVIRGCHLEGGGSSLEIFDFTKPVTIQRNTLVVGKDGVHLSMNQGLPVDGVDINSTNLVLENEMYGGSMRLLGVYAIRVERNIIHRGGFVWVRNVLPDSEIVVRSNQWRRLSEDRAAALFMLGTNFGSLIFSGNDIRDCEVAGDIFVLTGRRAGTNPEKFDFRKNTVANCTGTRALLRVDDAAWQIRRNSFLNVTAPISVDISEITSRFTSLSTAPETYRNITHNYWGSTFSDDIASGHRQTVLDALSSTKSNVAIVDFGTVLTGPIGSGSKAKKRRVSVPIGSLIRSDGTLGGIVFDGTHVIDADDLDGPSVVNLHLFVAGNAEVRITGGNQKRSRLLFRKDIAIRVLEEGKLIIEGKRNGDNGRYLELAPLDEEEKWGRVSLHSTTNATISGVHMRNFGGIVHRGAGSLTVSNSWVEGRPPPTRFSREFDECLISTDFTKTTLRISGSTFSNCYGGFHIVGRDEVLISNSSLTFFGQYGMSIIKVMGKLEILDSAIYSTDYDDYLTKFSSIIYLDYAHHGSGLANDLIIRNTVLNSNSSKAVEIDVCFSNIHMENNAFNFRHYAILYHWVATSCAVDSFSIRNNTFRDAVVVDGFVGPAAIEISYKPNRNAERRGEGLVIADNSFHNVTHGHMIRANVHDAGGTSVQITGNFFDNDCMALGYGGSTPPAFIYLAPWNCPGTTDNETDPATICSVNGNTFMDRPLQETDESFYFLAADFGESLNASGFTIDATRTYWGLTKKRDIPDRILVLDGGEAVQHQDIVQYLPYRLSVEEDAKLSPVCANINRCSNHGVCVNKSLCECWSGWEGLGCNVPSKRN